MFFLRRLSLGKRQQQPTGIEATVGCTLRSCRLMYVTDSQGRRFLVDSGSEVSLLPPSEPSTPLANSPVSLRAANGSAIAVYDTGHHLSIDLGLGRTYAFEFVIADVPTPILGADFLRQHGLVLDMKNSRLVDGRTFLAAYSSTTADTRCHPPVAHIASHDATVRDGTCFAHVRNSELFRSVCVPPSHFPCVKTPGVTHRIVTRGHPVFSRPRRLAPVKQAALQKELDQLLSQGILVPSSSPWASPIHLVHKDGGASYRMVGCYERLNAITTPDRYPVPDIQTFADQLHGATVFSTIDLARAFAQIPLARQDQQKTAITTPLGLFHFTRLPFGLRNAAQSFQRLMDTVLRGMQRVFVYIDDILVYSPDPETHKRDLTELFERLRKHGLVIRPEKCSLGRDSVRFLGLEVTAAGVKPTSEKVNDLLNMSAPRDTAECRRFIGMINFYHRFVPGLATILRPLHDLANQPKRHFAWTEELTTAFERAKNALAAASLLSYPLPDAVTQVAADASDKAVGAVIQQFQAGRWVPLAYHSKKLSPQQEKWSTGDKELFALFSAVKRFQHLLEGRTGIQLLTDHRPLTFAFTSKTRRSARVERQLGFLSEFSTDIRHVSGCDNAVPDCLSRPPCPEPSNETFITAVTRSCLDLHQLAKDQRGCSEVRVLATSPSLKIEKREFPEVSGHILVDVSTGTDRPLIPVSMQRSIFDSVHNLSHPGARATRKLLSERFVFKGMASKSNTWAKACVRCQQAKVYRHQRTPLSRPPTPTERFAALHVDIVGPFHEVNGLKYLFTIVDRYTRYPDCIPMSDATSTSCAKALLEWISRFGMCTRVTSDRGRQFVSELWAELCQILGVEHSTSLSYMPQQNGLVERMHRQLKASLVAVLNGHSDWPSAVPLVLLGMRAAYKPDLGTSAAQLVFGEAVRLPREFFRNPDTAEQQSTSELTRELRKFLRAIAPTPTAWHRAPSENRPFVHAALEKAAHVFVRVDGYKPPLQPPYKGPFRVLARGPKSFLLEMDGRTDSVAIDRLKPAFVHSDDQPASDLPSGSSPSRGERQTADRPAASPPRLAQSRAGRILRPPQRLIDASPSALGI